MALFRLKVFLPSAGATRTHALASALLVLSGSFAAAAGLPLPRTGSALHVQFRQDQYGRYQQDQYGQDQSRQGQRRYDDQQGGYGPGQGQRRYDDQQDGYGRDRGPGRGRREEPQDRLGQQGGGRGGSYQQTCGDIRQEGSTLSAVCDDGRGRRVESSIDVNRCGRADVGNNHGYLQCGNIRGNGR